MSSLHVTFNSEEDTAHLSADAGYLTRYGIQYHWENDGYATFDDFLMSLRQSKRKSIRQERKCAAKNDLRVYRALGSEMSASDWDTFYQVSGRHTQCTLTAAGLSHVPKLTLILSWILPVLPQHLRQEVGRGLPEQGVLSDHGRNDGRQGHDGLRGGFFW